MGPKKFTASSKPAQPPPQASPATTGQPGGDPSQWPVYRIRYKVPGEQYKELRLEWHHRPIDADEVSNTLRVVREYVESPPDGPNQNGECFRTLRPDYCTVLSGPHATLTSKTERPPDGRMHVSLRFSRQQDRASAGSSFGWSVHICTDESGSNLRRDTVIWTSATPDSSRQRAVHQNRTAWPMGAGPNDAPWAPDERFTPPPPSTAGLVDAPIPAVSAWSTPLALAQSTPTTPTHQQGVSPQTPSASKGKSPRQSSKQPPPPG